MSSLILKHPRDLVLFSAFLYAEWSCRLSSLLGTHHESRQFVLLTGSCSSLYRTFTCMLIYVFASCIFCVFALISVFFWRGEQGSCFLCCTLQGYIHSTLNIAGKLGAWRLYLIQVIHLASDCRLSITSWIGDSFFHRIMDKIDMAYSSR